MILSLSAEFSEISLAGFYLGFKRFQNDFGLDLICLETSMFHLYCASNCFALIKRSQADLASWYAFQIFCSE